MDHKYGYFTSRQIKVAVKRIRKNIFFLLLCADPNEDNKYSYVNLNDAFESILFELGGMNDVLFEPPELVKTISLLNAAREEYNSPSFCFSRYRKGVLDAGAMVAKLGGGDSVGA